MEGGDGVWREGMVCGGRGEGMCVEGGVSDEGMVCITRSSGV